MDIDKNEHNCKKGKQNNCRINLLRELFYWLYPSWNGVLSGVLLEIGDAGPLELEKVQAKIANAMLTVECILSHTGACLKREIGARSPP